MSNTNELTGRNLEQVVKDASFGLELNTDEVLGHVHLVCEPGHVFCEDGDENRRVLMAAAKSIADMISTRMHQAQYLSARLAMIGLREVVWGGQTPPSLGRHVRDRVEEGWYDPMLLEVYDDEQLEALDREIDHSRDMSFTWVATGQLLGKYLIKNRVDGTFHETPQFAYMVMCMTAFVNEPDAVRLDLVKRAYHLASNHVISLPTPIMAGLRTPTRQFSSCVLIDCDDSLDSINATSSSIVKYVSQRAGIGVNIGRIRALGSPIRGGEAYHTGMIPFIKLFQAAVKSCSQGGVRGGAATLFYPVWHLEVESLLVLKNNRGVEENRARHLDYGVQINRLMYRRLIEGGDITLFSPSDVPGLYEAFFSDQDEFERLYTLYEADESIRKKRIKAIDLFSILAQERAQTGRIYIQNVDHCNDYGAFDSNVAPVHQSNLCMEITLPTKPLDDIHDENGEIALCTLAAINLGTVNLDDDMMKEACHILVRLLDNLLDYQDYPVKAARVSTEKRRPLGVGVTNYAYFLAKNGVRYSDGSANEITHRVFESMQYHLIEASVELAKERGACEAFGETLYAKGVLPVDNYRKQVDDLVVPVYRKDWDALRKAVLEHGMRNSTLTALMPCETSSQVSNSTNGIEPPRGLVVVKSSKDGIFRQVLPEAERLAHAYETLWDMPDNKGYLDLVAIMQKFVDQAISANTNYDPSRFPDGKVPVKVILRDILRAYKHGVKTLYYHNTRDGMNDAQEDDGCAGGACKI